MPFVRSANIHSRSPANGFVELNYLNVVIHLCSFLNQATQHWRTGTVPRVSKRPINKSAACLRARYCTNFSRFDLAKVLNQDDVALPTAAGADQLLAIAGYVEAENAVGFEIGHLSSRTPIDGLRPDIGDAVG